MKKYLFLIILPLLMFLPTNVFASEFTTVNTNFYNLFQNTDVSFSSDTSLSYKTTDNFNTSTQYILAFNSSLSVPDNANYFYFQTYTQFWNGDNSNVKNFYYNFNVSIRFTNQHLVACEQLSNYNEHNVGYITWKCPIPTHGTEIHQVRFYGFEQALDDYLDVASRFKYGVYNWFMLFEFPDSDNIDSSITENTQDIINSNTQTQNKIDKTNETLQETNDYLTSDEEPDADVSALGNVQGLLPPGPVDSLLNIPFKFLSIIVSSLGDLCVPLSMSWVFNQSLTLPCFSDSFYNNVPSGLMVFINLIPTGFILIIYFKHLYKKVNRAVSMETTADDEWGVL